MDLCLGILEVQGLGPAFVVADRVIKTAAIEIPGIELNSLGGLTIKMVGDAGAVAAAVERGCTVAAEMRARCVPTRLLRFPESLRSLVYCAPRYSAIIQDRTQLLPVNEEYAGRNVSVGLLETLGFVGALAGADAMLKAADVHLIGKEKIGATYTDVLIQGDLSAVQAAIEAGERMAAAVGNLVGGYVIPRPHPDLLSLLPNRHS